MALLYFMLWIAWRCRALFLSTKPLPDKPFYPRKRSTQPGHLGGEEDMPPPDDKDSQPAMVRRRKKPQWVIDEVIYLKAVNPLKGCRKIAETFSRLHEHKTQMTVSKSYVYETLKKHRYEVQALRRLIKHRKPGRVPKNVCWGIDLTAVTDEGQTSHLVLAIIDYGSRRCLCLHVLPNKRSLTLLLYLLKAIRAYGKPNAVKTDNEAVFTSRLFNAALALCNVKHQLSDIASPWENGRVERFIGTFKEKIATLAIPNQARLAACLPEFRFWYNAVRPHQHLDGKTPLEVWHGVDVFNEGYKRLYRFEAWDGRLTGYYLLT